MGILTSEDREILYHGIYQIAMEEPDTPSRRDLWIRIQGLLNTLPEHVGGTKTMQGLTYRATGEVQIYGNSPVMIWMDPWNPDLKKQTHINYFRGIPERIQHCYGPQFPWVIFPVLETIFKYPPQKNFQAFNQISQHILDFFIEPQQRNKLPHYVEMYLGEIHRIFCPTRYHDGRWSGVLVIPHPETMEALHQILDPLPSHLPCPFRVIKKDPIFRGAQDQIVGILAPTHPWGTIISIPDEYIGWIGGRRNAIYGLQRLDQFYQWIQAYPLYLPIVEARGLHKVHELITLFHPDS